MDFFLHVCMYTVCVPGAHRDRYEGNRSSGTGIRDPVSYHVGAGNWICVFWTDRQCSLLLNYLFNIMTVFLRLILFHVHGYSLSLLQE